MNTGVRIQLCKIRQNSSHYINGCRITSNTHACRRYRNGCKVVILKCMSDSKCTMQHLCTACVHTSPASTMKMTTFTYTQCDQSIGVATVTEGHKDQNEPCYTESKGNQHQSTVYLYKQRGQQECRIPQEVYTVYI